MPAPSPEPSVTPTPAPAPTSAPAPRPTVPGAPSKVAATGSDRAAKVTFTVPADGGAEVLGYEYRLGAGTWKTAKTSEATNGRRSFTITGLKNGTTYSVNVRALNAVGAGTASHAARVFVNSPAPKVSTPSSAVRVPAKPRSYDGPREVTKARWTSYDGTPAPAIGALGHHALVKGEAATLSKTGMFTFNSAKLTKAGRAELKQLAKNLTVASAVRCEGYTDYAGPTKNHARLGTARAKAVCAALKHYGANVKTTTKNYMGARPVVVGGKRENRAENRRVVVLVTADRR